MKVLASLFPPVGCQLAATSLGIFETSGIGVQWDNYDVIYKNYSFSNFLNISIASFFLFLILGLYLDKVMPSKYGIPRKPTFSCCPPTGAGVRPTRPQNAQISRRWTTLRKKTMRM